MQTMLNHLGWRIQPQQSFNSEGCFLENFKDWANKSLMMLTSAKHKDLRLEQNTMLQKQLRSTWLSSSPAEQEMFVMTDAKLKDNNALSTQ